VKNKNVILSKKYKCIQVLPDIHAPWVHWPALKQAKKWHDKHKPDLVIQLGDLTDQKIWSRWQASPDDYSPSQEYIRASKALEKIHSWFPEMHIIRGNHDERIKLRAVEAGIPGMMFRDVDDVFNFDGWTWVGRTQQLLVKTARGWVWFFHGDEFGGSITAKSRLIGANAVCGHTHKAGIHYTQILDKHIFGAQMGCLMDANSKAGEYAQPNPVGVSVGFGVIKHGVPYFIPYYKGVQV